MSSSDSRTPFGGTTECWPSRSEPLSRSPRSVEALREIEFDRQTGKLSDADYATLKASYTERALAELRTEKDTSAPTATEPPAQRVPCPECGPRPESDAVYCSECGRYLSGACAVCGASVTETGARYCTGCGNALAA